MVTLRYPEHDSSQVEVLFNGTSHGLLVPLDVVVNARILRSRFTILEFIDGQSQEDTRKYDGGKLWKVQDV